MTDEYNSIELTPDQWVEKYWKKNQIPFHKTETNRFLMQYHDLVCKKEISKIFLPLCGKSVDIKWLADKGHDVIGLEYSVDAILAFFKENNLEYTQTKNGPFNVYKAESCKITMYQGDFYQISSQLCGKVDSVWDRGSFVAIDENTRKRYSEVINELLDENGEILLESYLYDPTKYPGPPHSVALESIQENFGEFCEIKCLHKELVVPNKFKLDPFTVFIHQMSKQNANH